MQTLTENDRKQLSQHVTLAMGDDVDWDFAVRLIVDYLVKYVPVTNICTKSIYFLDQTRRYSEYINYMMRLDRVLDLQAVPNYERSLFDDEESYVVSVNQDLLVDAVRHDNLYPSFRYKYSDNGAHANTLELWISYHDFGSRQPLGDIEVREKEIFDRDDLKTENLIIKKPHDADFKDLALNSNAFHSTERDDIDFDGFWADELVPAPYGTDCLNVVHCCYELHEYYKEVIEDISEQKAAASRASMPAADHGTSEAHHDDSGDASD